MNARHQLPPTATPSQFPVERLTASQYVDQLADQYRRGCALYVAAEPLTDQNYSTRGIACL